jgi:hypothetical protein
VITPLDVVGQGLVKAYLEIDQPRLPSDQARVPVKFNPTEYQLQKQNTFAEIGIPGLETPPIQFIRGASEKLSAELLVDTSDTLDDVRVKYVNRLRKLLNIQSELHAPPIVKLIWDTQIFRGVVESLSIAYTMFRPDGVPIRAKLSLALKEYRPVEVQVRERPTLSPDFEKSYMSQRGDTLASIAFQCYRDATVWREIARANQIRDPRRLEPGRVLRIPKLR